MDYMVCTAPAVVLSKVARQPVLQVCWQVPPQVGACTRAMIESATCVQMHARLVGRSPGPVRAARSEDR